MKSIAEMISSIALLLGKPKNEKIGMLRQLRRAKKQAQKFYFKMRRKLSRKGLTEDEKKQLDLLFDTITDLSDEIKNINN